MPREAARGGQVMVELVRLVTALLLFAAGFAVGPPLADATGFEEVEELRLLTSGLGVLIGYVLGGYLGRRAVYGVDLAQERLQRVDASVLVAAVVGATLGAFLGMVLLIPVLFLPGKVFTVPVAVAILLVLLYTGGRLGAARGGDLSRFVGVRGRLEVSSPAKGGGTKVVDSSALMDGRLVEVARAGFLEGTLIVPEFVLHEMQSIADAQDARRRNMGRRGLDALKALQDEHLVAIEITQQDPPGIGEVDAKLTAVCRDRGAALITVDSNLSRVAEVSGVRVLNLHVLAESMRPPAIPGDEVELKILRRGTEEGQGVGYLDDGTMVVVERAADEVGSTVRASITSIMQNRQGRMLFASMEDQPT
ncbi:MAG: TRAM domain-containing protein [Nitriliruptorales bacterium]|nr:TRAM domain-containing protein [Nitriliruptorales bacterium]